MNQQLALLEDMTSDEWPADGRTLVAAVLADPETSDEDMLLALSLAGAIGITDDTLAELMLAVLQDEGRTVAVRAAAAESFAQPLEMASVDMDMTFVDVEQVGPGPYVSGAVCKRVVTALNALYTDGDTPADIRRGALESLARFPQDWLADAVRQAWASDDLDWQSTAVICMLFVPGFRAEIAAALASDDPYILYFAVIAADNWGVRGAWDRVAALAGSPATESDLRLAAIRALPQAHLKKGTALLKTLALDPDADVREAANFGLMMAGIEVDLDAPFGARTD
jgi:uncharacterized protein (UPF0147 family)